MGDRDRIDHDLEDYIFEVCFIKTERFLSPRAICDALLWLGFSAWLQADDGSGRRCRCWIEPTSRYDI